MNPIQFLFILRAHYKIALIVAVTTVVIALAVTLLLPKQFVATTSVLVDVKSPDPIASLIMPSSVATQVDVINSDRAAMKVVKALRLADSPAARDQWMSATDGQGTLEMWLAQVMKKGLKVDPSRDSNIVNISYRAGDPEFAASVANAFAQSYIDITIELKVDPARQYARWFGDQGKVLRDNVEKAQAQLSAYQQEKGIVAREEQLDTEMAKLSQLTTELVRVQAQTSDARSKQKSGSAGDTLPEVLASPVVSGLRSEIARQEAKLQEVAGNLGTNHPQYLRMQSEVVALKQKLEGETRLIMSSFSSSRAVGTAQELGLKTAIAAQKTKLLEFKNERDQLAVLQRDVDAARNAYDAVTKRYNETALASQATQTNVSVLSPAVAPLQPSSPKPVLQVLMMSIGLGIVLGLGAAFMLEMLDRRIRSTADLAEALPFPVLGEIVRPKLQVRLALLDRSLSLMLK